MDPANPMRREIEQAVAAVKNGAYLLKHGRRGRPKLCHFRVADDESVLLWSSKNKMKQLILSQVLRIEYGQRTVNFQRHLQHDKEDQSFSLIYNGKSLDLVCNDKEEAEVWFIGLLELISYGDYRRRWRRDSVSTSVHSQASGLDSAGASLSSALSSSSQGFAHDNGEASGEDENYANLVDKIFGNIFYFVGSPTPKAQMREAEFERTSNPQKEKIAIAGKESGKCKID